MQGPVVQDEGTQKYLCLTVMSRWIQGEKNRSKLTMISYQVHQGSEPFTDEEGGVALPESEGIVAN